MKTMIRLRKIAAVLSAILNGSIQLSRSDEFVNYRHQ